MQQTLKFVRSTKGTHLYEQMDESPTNLTRNVYVMKAALPKPPETITITLEVPADA